MKFLIEANHAMCCATTFGTWKRMRGLTMMLWASRTYRRLES